MFLLLNTKSLSFPSRKLVASSNRFSPDKLTTLDGWELDVSPLEPLGDF